ncbi:MAG: C-GCAxxG-C-C family protein [Ileibacterium sp.]|nr:C-GCAxxG-C-C family protein [Ileibacterium sp.]
MNLKEQAEYYYTQHDYNCAESLIHACNDVYGLNITNDDMKMLAGFGGGMFSGGPCGALIAISAALSKMVIKSKAHEERDVIMPAQQMVNRKFKQLLSGTTCPEVKVLHFDPEKRCLNTVLLAAQAMEETLAELNIAQN